MNTNKISKRCQIPFAILENSFIRFVVLYSSMPFPEMFHSFWNKAFNWRFFLVQTTPIEAALLASSFPSECDAPLFSSVALARRAFLGRLCEGAHRQAKHTWFSYQFHTGFTCTASAVSLAKFSSRHRKLVFLTMYSRSNVIYCNTAVASTHITPH